MISGWIALSLVLLYDVAPGVYSLDYDGYGYSDPSGNTPQALAQTFFTDTVFREPQMDMKIVWIRDSGAVMEIATAGSRFVFDETNSTILCHQLVGLQRELIRIRFDADRLEGLRLQESSCGYVLLASDELTLRLNGDGILMTKATSNLEVHIDILFEFGYLGRTTPSEKRRDFSHLYLDEHGGFGVYLIEDEGYELDARRATYRFREGQVFWIAVFPPREYDEERAGSRLIFYKGNSDFSFSPVYPTVKEFDRWSGVNVDSVSFRSDFDGKWGTNPDHTDYGEIVALTSDVELWTFWHTEYVPADGWDRFHKTIELAHARGKKIIFYVSPSQFYEGSRYFVEGSEHYLGECARPPLIRDIDQIYKERQSWPPGNPEGENMEEFLSAVKLMVDHRGDNGGGIADGIYVDGLYFLNLPRSYILMRELRRIVGDVRTICVHSAPLPGGDAYLPTLEAYADHVLKGEGGREHYDDPEYFRYFIRTHGISNASGIFINQRDARGNYIPLDGFLGATLVANRLQTRFESPLVDLLSRWDATHNWEDYRLGMRQLWEALSLGTGVE